MAAGLFLRSLLNAQAVEPGFNPRGVLVATLFLPSPGYDGARSAQFYQRLIERLEVLPEVRSASLAQPGLEGSPSEEIEVEGYAPEADERPWSHLNTISPGYFRTLDVPLVGGRDLSFQDVDRSAGVAMINEPLRVGRVDRHEARVLPSYRDVQMPGRIPRSLATTQDLSKSSDFRGSRPVPGNGSSPQSL